MAAGLGPVTLSLALTLAAATAGAVDFGARSLSKAFPYKDLPGVTEPQPDYAKSRPPVNCTRQLVSDHRLGRSWRQGDRPVAVYSCEQNGITIESTEAPLTRDWYPGITPDR